MAKIRLGGIVSQASGSLDGVTFSHNRNGRYVRARVKPTNPKSVKQTAVRAQLSNISQSWRSIGQPARQQWTALGQQMTQTNSLGEATTLTGLQAYVSINQLRLTAGLAIVTTAPTLDSPPSINAGALVSTVATTGTLTIAYNPIPGPAQSVRVYATGNLSAGRQFIRRSQYRYLQNITNASVSPIDLKAAWVATYGPVAAGMVGSRVSFLLVAVSVNGLAGPAQRFDTFWS